MNNKKIICLTGPKGSGKSHFSKLTVDKLNYTLIKFADPLKNMLRAIGLTDREIEGELKEKPCYLLGGQTPRYAMQTLGTEWGRKIVSTDMWTDIFLNRVSNSPGNIICDDMRFPNEYECLADLNTLVIKIQPHNPTMYDSHESENHDLPHDHILVNSYDKQSESRLFDILNLTGHMNIDKINST